MNIDEDRNKDRFKNPLFCSVWKLPCHIFTVIFQVVWEPASLRRPFQILLLRNLKVWIRHRPRICLLSIFQQQHSSTTNDSKVKIVIDDAVEAHTLTKPTPLNNLTHICNTKTVSSARHVRAMHLSPTNGLLLHLKQCFSTPGHDPKAGRRLMLVPRRDIIIQFRRNFMKSGA